MGEYTSGFPSWRASDAELWCFVVVSLNMMLKTVELPVIWDAKMLMWHHLTHCSLVMPYGKNRSESTLDQVMACCLKASSHHWNQCWLHVTRPVAFTWVYFCRTWLSHQLIKCTLTSYTYKIPAMSPRGQWVNEWMNEQTNERTNEWTKNEWMNEWMNDLPWPEWWWCEGHCLQGHTAGRTPTCRDSLKNNKWQR